MNEQDILKTKAQDMSLEDVNAAMAFIEANFAGLKPEAKSAMFTRYGILKARKRALELAQWGKE